MLALRLPPEIEQRLDALAKRTGRSKSWYARQAILQYLDDLEDDYLATSRVEEPQPPFDSAGRKTVKTTKDKPMPRTLINLTPDEKEWLDREARARHVPMDELVHQAVRAYRLNEERDQKPALHAMLDRTVGIWPGGDALDYQRRIRDEWDERS